MPKILAGKHSYDSYMTQWTGRLHANNRQGLHTHWYPCSRGAVQSQLQVHRKCKQPRRFRPEGALLGDRWAEPQRALIHAASWLAGLLAADVILLLGGKLLPHRPQRWLGGDGVPRVKSDYSSNEIRRPPFCAIVPAPLGLLDDSVLPHARHLTTSFVRRCLLQATQPPAPSRTPFSFECRWKVF